MYATWDIETTITTRFKRKANPYIPENWTVTHGVKHKGDSAVREYRFGSDRPGPGWLKPVLYTGDTPIKLLIGMNIKFDLQHALTDPVNLGYWMKWVADGGMVWDIQLAEYLLCGQEQASQMLSLNEIAVRYGGNLKVDEVAALWEAGVNTPDIEPELLTRYLCGGLDHMGVFQMGDVENTEQVALQQIKLARERGQLNSIMLNMGALLYTVEAERNGMFVDTVQGMILTDELRAKLIELTLLLDSFVPELPFEFNWNSRFHKSALIFGGTVEFNCKQYDCADGSTIWKHDYDKLLAEGKAPTLLYAQQDEEHYQLADGGTMAIEAWQAMEDPPALLLNKSGKNEGMPKTKKVKVNNLDKPKGREVKESGLRPTFTFAGYTKPEKKWEGADKGVYSTAAEVIEELEERNEDVPFLKAFIGMAKVAKDLGTYFLSVDPETGEKKGMLSLVGTDGLIHHMLNMVSTITARLSSSNPNLQNIPKGNKSDVKLLFKSRFGKWITDDFGNQVWVSDGKIIQSDFSSLEVYVQAILTGCKQLIADLKAGLDLHVVRLAAKEKMEYEEVLKLAKGWTETLPDGTEIEHAAIKEWDYKRTGAKVYSFQRAFGAGNKKIATSTGMALEEVEALSSAEDERYPEIARYYERITEEVYANRKPLRVIPHPDIPGVLCHIGKSYYRTPDGKLYTYEQNPAPDYQVKRGITASFMPTEIKNYVVQGSGGEWAKAAMYLAVRAFYARENFGGLGLLVNQVHDATYADAHNSVAFECAALLHACMEAASDYMEWKFKWQVPVPVPSDTSWGYSMMDEDKIPGIKERAAVLRTELREQYMGGYTPSFLH